MARKSRKNVGLIGLGIIGARVAAGLRASGFQVFVWNRTAKPAPNFVGSPAEVAELCEIIQIFVSDAQALFDVIEQMKESLTAQHIVICNATVGPEATMEAARVVEECGAHFLDAPFTGSRSAAEKRSLVYYIGGEETVFLRARPVLEASSKAIVRIGGIGHAATVKVVTNMIAAVSIQTLGEALAIVQKAGLDPEVLAAALEQNACRSPTMDLKLPKMIAGDYDPHFSLKHMFKDVQLGIHIANALDIEIPATTVTAGVMYGALNQGWGELDFSALYKIYEPQVAGGATAAELQSGYAQIEDLDTKSAHYPETREPAPPRPGSDLGHQGKGLGEEAKGSDTAPPEEKKAEVPPLAAALTALDGVRPVEPAAFEKTGEPAPPMVQLGSAGIHLAPLDHGAVLPAGAIILGAPEPPKEGASSVAGAPGEEPKKEASPAEPEQGLPRIVDFPAQRESSPAAGGEVVIAADKVVEVAAEKRGRGVLDEPAEAGSKPFNFVKRWFVSRNGG